MKMRKISKNLLIIMFLIVFIFSLPAAVMAEDMSDMPGMDGEQSDQAPVEPGSPGYKPIEQAADDSTMAMIAADEHLRDTLAAAGHRRIRDEFSIQTNVARHARLYEELARGTGPEKRL
ncbi:hypothetical protein LCGC14_0513080 [marine sediment metagenome]|uniref:Uncharacterized protein n=1 Tax=marine sediment metagenome TaxID=412755 RepID=A0A0F9S0S6_9ZZZZ